MVQHGEKIVTLSRHGTRQCNTSHGGVKLHDSIITEQASAEVCFKACGILESRKQRRDKGHLTIELMTVGRCSGV
jgi:hypothetical protein